MILIPKSVKFYYSVCIALIFILPSGIHAQPRSLSLEIGDVVPDIQFAHVLNYKKNSIKLSDFRGKLIIMDMWNTACASCIKQFPRLSELQKKFAGKLQILLVNSLSDRIETQQRVQNTINRFKIRTGYDLDLPICLFDTVINKYLPHTALPFYAWIDERGRLVGMTNEIALADIQAVLNGKAGDLALKDDRAYNFRMPLLFNKNGGEDTDFIYRSVFTRYNHKMQCVIGNRTEENSTMPGYYIYNYPLMTMIGMAFEDELAGLPP